MAALSIRDLDDDIRDRLRVRAARNGRSMEAEVRSIITAAVHEPEPEVGFAQALMSAFGAAGGVDLELPARTELPRAASFDE